MSWAIRQAISENAFHYTCMKRKSEKKTREALEINKLKTNNEKDKTFTVLNRDNGDYVTTNPWKPLFIKMETIQFEKHLSLREAEISLYNKKVL